MSLDNLYGLEDIVRNKLSVLIKAKKTETNEYLIEICYILLSLYRHTREILICTICYNQNHNYMGLPTCTYICSYISKYEELLLINKCKSTLWDNTGGYKTKDYSVKNNDMPKWCSNMARNIYDADMAAVSITDINVSVYNTQSIVQYSDNEVPLTDRILLVVGGSAIVETLHNNTYYKIKVEPRSLLMFSYPDAMYNKVCIVPHDIRGNIYVITFKAVF